MPIDTRTQLSLWDALFAKQIGATQQPLGTKILIYIDVNEIVAGGYRCNPNMTNKHVELFLSRNGQTPQSLGEFVLGTGVAEPIISCAVNLYYTLNDYGIFNFYAKYNGDLERNPSTSSMVGVQVPAPPPPPVRYILKITPALGGATNPAPGQYNLAQFSKPSVTAVPQENYIFDHWNLDGVNVGSSNPIIVTMDTHHLLEPVFTYSPAPPTEAPPVAPPVAPPTEVPPTEVPPTPPPTPPPTIEIIPTVALPPTVPPLVEVPPPPVTPEVAGLIVLGAVVVVIVIGAAVWYFTKPVS